MPGRTPGTANKITSYCTGFVQSQGGLIKTVQVLIGLALMMTLMVGHYDGVTTLYRLRMDAFLLVMTAFTFVLTSALLLLCTVLGATELPSSNLYRVTYLLATLTYVPLSVGFIFEEYFYGDVNQTIAGGVLSIVNALVYMVNLCVSYRLRWLKKMQKSRFDLKEGRGEGKGRTGNKEKTGDVLVELEAAGQVTQIRSEHDLLATGDVETSQLLELIQQTDQLTENNPTLTAPPASATKYFMEPLDSSPRKASPMGAKSPEGAKTPTGRTSPQRCESGAMLSGRVDDDQEVSKGESLPGEEQVLLQPAVGRDYIVLFRVEGRKSTSKTETHESEGQNKSPEKNERGSGKGSKKGSQKSSQKGSKEGAKKGSKSEEKKSCKKGLMKKSIKRVKKCRKPKRQ